MARRPASRRVPPIALRPRRRPAFTLVEMLVALGLSVVLVTAIYGALSMYLRISQGDQWELYGSRLARGLLRQMTMDLQSVVFRVQKTSSEGSEEESSSSSTSGGSTSGSSTQTQTITIASTDETLQSTSVGLIGDARKLTVHVNRPARDLNYQPVLSAGGVGSRTSDLQSITYFLADPAGSGLEGIVGQRAMQMNSGPYSFTGPQGLVRLVGDRMAIEYADIESDLNTLALAAEIIAPEVISLEFRYFDGLNWAAEWDSVALQRLPNAVEITVGMRRIVSEEERRRNQDNAQARAQWDQIVEVRRHVVALPLATPFAGGI